PPAFAALAFALIALDTRLPHAAWRTFACLAALSCFVASLNCVGLALNGAPGWDPRLTLISGFVSPAAITGLAASLARRNQAGAASLFLQIIAVGLSVIAGALAVRLLFSSGTPLLQPITFVEAGFQIAASLVIALFI